MNILMCTIDYPDSKQLLIILAIIKKAETWRNRSKPHKHFGHGQRDAMIMNIFASEGYLHMPFNNIKGSVY